MLPRGSRHLFWSHPRDDGGRLQRRSTCMLLRQQPNGCVTWVCAFVYMETKKEFFSCDWTRWQKNAVLKDKIGKFYDKYHRHRVHQSNGAAEKAVSTARGLGRTYLAVLKDKIPSFDSDNTLSDASVDDQTRSMDSHSTKCEKRYTNDSVREDSWIEIQRRNPPSG